VIKVKSDDNFKIGALLGGEQGGTGCATDLSDGEVRRIGPWGAPVAVPDKNITSPSIVSLICTSATMRLQLYASLHRNWVSTERWDSRLLGMILCGVVEMCRRFGDTCWKGASLHSSDFSSLRHHRDNLESRLMEYFLWVISWQEQSQLPMRRRNNSHICVQLFHADQRTQPLTEFNNLRNFSRA
jgi:hypothetical protein